ncbi:MAG TPA: cytochrome c-type biogenesis protein CcmH [Gemmatimonadales bacterium]|nr:cytochrome c-type biogenesis protein CcmH [Gemmatimonadales bacterium]
MLRKSAPSLLTLLALAAGGLAAQTPRDSALSAAVRARSSDSLGRLEVPDAAGRPVAAATARDDAALVQAIEHQIRCTCGCNLDVFTCRTTDFTCTTSPAMHQLVLARLDSGLTEAQVLASFQRQYGEMIFMAPPKHGFNWMAYVMPYVGLAVGLGLVTAAARRLIHARAAGTAPAAASGPPPAAGSPEELERLKRELERFEA